MYETLFVGELSSVVVFEKLSVGVPLNVALSETVPDGRSAVRDRLPLALCETDLETVAGSFDAVCDEEEEILPEDVFVSDKVEV